MKNNVLRESCVNIQLLPEYDKQPGTDKNTRVTLDVHPGVFVCPQSRDANIGIMAQDAVEVV